MGVQPQQQQTYGDPFKVMVVDDSAIIRGFLSRYLTEDKSIEIVTTANNGEVALRQLDRYDIEVVVLDIEMPVMDGLTALPKMLKKKPDLQIVMASTLTLRNADVSLKALGLGAVDYVPKPETTRSVNSDIDFRRELVEKVKVWAARRRRRSGTALPPEMAKSLSPTQRSGLGLSQDRAQPSGFVTASRRPTAATFTRASALDRGKARQTDDAGVDQENSKSGIALRPDARQKPDVLAIGSSTGGPQALMKFFSSFREKPTVPVVITQHMPAMFTAILAEHLAQTTGWKCYEAEDGLALENGNIYIAKGGLHMVLEQKDGNIVIRHFDGPPENFCKPSVDTMLRSMVPIYGDRVLVVMLTGMGHDGLKGSRDVVRGGGALYAQDEATSVVWGMPGAVATAGLCSKVLPLDVLGETVEGRLKRCL